MVPDKTIGRLSLYRRLLIDLGEEGKENIFSHELARLAGATAAQVRRDLMAIGYSGNTQRGYGIDGLIASLGEFLDKPGGQGVALVGMGNIGRAVVAYLAGRRPNLAIAAVFDNDPNKAGHSLDGLQCRPMAELGKVLRTQHIHVAIIAVPAEYAQGVADRLVAEGVRGIVNFAPVPLRVPPEVYVEDIDMTTSLEKAAYFAQESLRNK